MRYFKFLLLFLIFACDIQHKNTLRIKSINKDKPLHIDVIDVYTIVVEGEPVEVEAIWDHYTSIEFIYMEFGIGLPTAPGTYTALLTDYEITFEDITPGIEEEDRFKGEKVKGKSHILIPSDPEGKEFKEATISVMPSSYIEMHRDELREFRVLGAKIKFKGKEILSEKDLEVEGTFPINIGDYYDDPKKLDPPR